MSFVINCLPNVVAAENVVVVVVVVVPMAEMVEKLSQLRCGIPVEFDGILQLLLVVGAILGIPVQADSHSFTTTQEACKRNAVDASDIAP